MLKRDAADNPILPDDADPPAPVAMQRKPAATVTSPSVNAKRTIAKWSGFGEVPFDGGLLKELETQITAIKSGDTGRHKEILAAHTETLDALFYSLMDNAYSYRGSPYMAERLRLALKVQARVCATIKALAEIESPRPIAVMQTSVTFVDPPAQVSRAVVRENSQNELLEHADHAERLDFGTPRAAGFADLQMEAVEAVNRSGDPSGES
jgi:hypothetical protein